MNAVGQLHPEQKLLLIAPFEPAPLFSVLARQGFDHASKQTQSGDWEVLFSRHDKAEAIGEGLNPPTPPAGSSSGNKSSETFEVDARGLEPPQPMVKILETLAALPEGAELRARTDRRPMHLYTRIETRGFKGETEEQTDGSFLTHIR
ncbi:MAG TPA: DUF2249 domain-containing protein, partial [Verrucomicrobiae bacterium]|nr:DUF2249 domain-containing protein [Verrucomicrobiae bacterium]